MRNFLLRIVSLFCLFALAHSVSAASLDSLQVSLLTVSAGPEVYERFGHTAIRISGLPNSRNGLPVVVGYAHNTELELPYPNLTRYNSDLVFHYGVFNFNAPNFVYRFVKGETDYSIGCIPYAFMLQDYEGRGLKVMEQTLNLTPEESRELLFKLLINYLPYNRKYRYNFFFDNCATRPYRLLQAATDSCIAFSCTQANKITLRDMLREKTGRNTWLDFGISLIIAGRADRKTTFEERMFLPEYLMEAYSHATVQRSDSASAPNTYMHPLVQETRVIVDGNPLIQAELEAVPCFWTSPTLCGWLLLALTVLLTWVERHTNRRMTWLDCLWLIATGLTGVMVWFLNFCSTHPAVDHNINCLWLVPTHLLFAVLIWIKCCKKVVDFYFFITFVALIVYLPATVYVRQFVHPAFIPMILSMAIRMWIRIRGHVNLHTFRHLRTSL